VLSFRLAQIDQKRKRYVGWVFGIQEERQDGKKGKATE
jgi:hypothetical protein